MRIDVKKTRVYLISPATDGKYMKRVLSVLNRLISKGFERVIFFKSVSGPSNTQSLTNTFVEIFKRELNHEEPFFILEDDCQFLKDYDKIDVPDDWDVLYTGVSYWAYTHPIETLYLMNRPHISPNQSPTTIEDYNDELVKIKSMLGAHSIIFLSRDFMRMFIELMPNFPNVPHDLLFAVLQPSFNVYGLKTPMFYQDKELGGQEECTKLIFDGHSFIR